MFIEGDLGNEERTLYCLTSVLPITVVVFVRSGDTLHQQGNRRHGETTEELGFVGRSSGVITVVH